MARSRRWPACVLKRTPGRVRARLCLVRVADFGMSHMSEVTVGVGAAAQVGNAEGGFYGRSAKRAFDLLLILISAPIVVPVVLLLAVLVRRDGGPAFFVQDRVGLDGRIFRIWKLRTMVVDAEARLAAHLDADPALRAEWDANQKLRDDPRVTAVGRFLRKTSLDELPQLWNVAPRRHEPRRPAADAARAARALPGPGLLRMRPGVTGLWQVSGRNETTFAGRAEFDADYARRMSLPTDVMILFLTVWVVLRGTGY